MTKKKKKVIYHYVQIEERIGMILFYQSHDDSKVDSNF